MKKTIQLSLILFYCVNAMAQLKPTPMSIGLGGGFDIISNKDINSSPLTYRGFGLPVGINGFKLYENWINHLEIQFILPLLTNNYALSTRHNTQLTTWTKVNLSYKFLRRIGNNNMNYLGFELNSNYFYREYDFLDGFGWEFQNSLNLNYTYSLILNENSFLLPRIGLPLFGYINRNPSLTYDEAFLDDFNNKGAVSIAKYGKWKTIFNEWMGVELELLYHINVSSRISLQTCIGFNFYKIEFPERVNNINIPIRCYLNYQL